MRLVRSFLLLFFSLLLATNTVTGYPESELTVCVVATRLNDDSYDFSLESGDNLQYIPGYDFLIPAAAWFNKSLDDLGMSFQTIKSSGEFDDTIQAYWAGFLELYTSREMTYAHLENTFGEFCEDNSPSCQTLRSQIERNLEMTIKHSVESGDIDPFWHQMELILWQMRGIQDAWNNITLKNSKSLTTDYLLGLLDNVFDIYLLQLNGDIGEITAALGVYDDLKEGSNGKQYFSSRASCSALVKLFPFQKDIFISHNTWQGYESMLKVMKYYEFDWHLTRNPDSPKIPADKMLFSSYPSTICSVDDFNVLSTGLVTQETTNSIKNPDLWPFVRHGLNSSLLEVFRIMIANRLSRTPSEWISFFSRANSGTYNNQWMVIDTKLIEKSKPLPTKDLLWVAEQSPGFVQSADVTDHLIRKGYWASYNNPYFEFIRNITGINAFEKEYGEFYSYDRTARAQIFRRDQGKVTDLPSMYRLMRYNDFIHDPLSRYNSTPPYTAFFAIAARGDLNDPNGSYPLPFLGYRLHGSTDVKLVNLAMVRSLSMIAVAGPTYDQVPVFEWSSAWPDKSRPLMHPDRWDFPPVVIQVDNGWGHWSQPFLRADTVQP
ncbi:unnamed protein product [Hymenolepis diminuta]|uniref:Phospholipase B-like n=1 Tax=Hymenolepis diminuta TaxID=6216 RepID=A0A564Z2N9_HYMDI|nr:unnamed protein product [Hymenolepis diminuta]